jgi:hypothetical protein
MGYILAPIEYLAPSIVPVALDPLGVDEDESFPVGKGVKTGAARHALGVRAAGPVQSENQGDWVIRFLVAWVVDSICAGHVPLGKGPIFKVTGSGAFMGTGGYDAEGQKQA